MEHRLSPNDREIEQALLGTMIRHERGIDEAASVITTPDEFYVYCHGLIFSAMLSMRAACLPVDPFSLKDELAKRGQLEECQGLAYLTCLWDEAPGPANARHFAEIIHSYFLRRRMIHFCAELTEEAYAPGCHVEELLATAERQFFSLSTLGATGQTVPQDMAVREYLAELDRRTGKTKDDGETEEPYIASGWLDLDKLMTGFFRDELTIIAARPAVGKTLFGVQIARGVAERGFKVFFVNLEQRRTEIVARMFSAKGRVESWKLRKAILDETDTGKIIEATGPLQGLPIHYDDTPGQTIQRISGNARRLKSRGELDLLVIDYLQLVSGDRFGYRHENRTQEVGYVSRSLKLLAREMKVPVVCLAQCGRSAEGRERPRLSDLRESGSIEQDADTVLILHKPQPPDPDRKLDLIEVDLAKQRHGPNGIVTMIHDKEFFSVSNYAGESM